MGNFGSMADSNLTQLRGERMFQLVEGLACFVTLMLQLHTLRL